MATGLGLLNQVEKRVGAVLLRQCFGSSAWVEHVLTLRPFASVDAAKHAFQTCASGMTDADWDEAAAGFSSPGPGLAVLHSPTRLQIALQKYRDHFGFRCIIPGALSLAEQNTESVIAQILQRCGNEAAAEQTRNRKLLLQVAETKLARLLVQLGDKSTSNAGFTRAALESSAIQHTPCDGSGALHPERMEYWHGTRMKGIISWDYKPVDVQCWGGTNYHRDVPDKITSVVPKVAVDDDTKTTEGDPRAIFSLGSVPPGEHRGGQRGQPPQQQQFFGGNWR